MLRSKRGTAHAGADHRGARQGHRPRAEAARHRARHGARGARRGRERRRHDRADRRRLPASLELREPGERAPAAAAGRRVGLARVRRHEPGRARGADPEAARQRHRALEGDLGRRLDAGARDCERQGRRRQVDALGQPRRGVRPTRAAHRDSRCRRLRPLDPAHARDRAASRRRRQDDRPAGAGRPEADVDRLLPRGELAGHVARADAPPRARAVPLGRALGRAGHARRRHAAGDGRRLDLARPAPPAGRGRRRDDAAGRCAAGRRARRPDGSEDRHAPDRGDREHVVSRRERAGALRRREAARLWPR